jgi:transcriptional regulator with XRE-family HTH domain
MSDSIRISLKAARVNAGMTMESVCEVLNISKTTIFNWENGNTIPDADMALKLSKLYKMPLENINFYRKS